MKLLAFVLLVLAVASSAVALKDPACGHPHAKDGDGRIACAAFIPSWTYRADTNQCVDFVYGGCGGNLNRFDSKQACESKCKQ